jgi:hypothetical protein
MRLWVLFKIFVLFYKLGFKMHVYANFYLYKNASYVLCISCKGFSFFLVTFFNGFEISLESRVF